jgi:hypothetical protein
MRTDQKIVTEDFGLEAFRISPEQIAQSRKAKEPVKPEKPLWCKFDYRRQMKLAQTTHNAAIAVQAELYRLWFRAYDKAEPIALPNTLFEKLGFSHHAKNRALKAFIKIGNIKVKWRSRKSPLITILNF